MSHPATMSGTRPTRSLNAPLGVLVADFTTCSIAQMIGSSAAETPSCDARSRMKASLELPSVKSSSTAR